MIQIVKSTSLDLIFAWIVYQLLMSINFRRSHLPLLMYLAPFAVTSIFPMFKLLYVNLANLGIVRWFRKGVERLRLWLDFLLCDTSVTNIEFWKLIPNKHFEIFSRSFVKIVGGYMITEWHKLSVYIFLRLSVLRQASAFD